MGDGNSSNFPPPAGMADEIIVKAIACLDADVWDYIGDSSVTIRTVRIAHESVRITISADGADVLKYGKPSEPYREAFKEAFARAVAREKEKRMTPLLAAIADDGHETRAARRERRHNLMTIAGLVVFVGLFAWAAIGITSCSTEVAQRQAARGSEVNKYGYRRGAIVSHKVWPDDCANSGWIYDNKPEEHHSFRSIYDCKTIWERWERDGDMWVDWKEDK